jgi:hypothetical protein
MNIAWENDLLSQFLDAHAETHENEQGAQGSVFGYLAPELLAPPAVPAPPPGRAKTLALRPIPRGPAASARPSPVTAEKTN